MPLGHMTPSERFFTKQSKPVQHGLTAMTLAAIVAGALAVLVGMVAVTGTDYQRPNTCVSVRNGSVCGPQVQQ